MLMYQRDVTFGTDEGGSVPSISLRVQGLPNRHPHINLDAPYWRWRVRVSGGRGTTEELPTKVVVV